MFYQAMLVIKVVVVVEDVFAFAFALTAVPVLAVFVPDLCQMSALLKRPRRRVLWLGGVIPC